METYAYPIKSMGKNTFCKRLQILKAALDATKSDACVLSREKLSEKINATGIEICLQAICENEKLVIFRKVRCCLLYTSRCV